MAILIIRCRKRGFSRNDFDSPYFLNPIGLSEKRLNKPKKLCENSIGFYRKFIKFMINFNSKKCYEIHEKRIVNKLGIR